ncbi:MAG: hypothetical protein NUV90_03275 [Candidatus Parcubacteria bacterium]|nr:hypothetical protein [Candidatus Parcubacteria bacterium]
MNMKISIPALTILFLMLPLASSAAALTSQQATSLITVVQSSPDTPASAFVNLITSFSNITVNQATSLITVVQSSLGASASAFVDLLTSFTDDTQIAQTPSPPATSAPDVCANIEGVQTTVPGGMTATGNVCVAIQSTPLVGVPEPAITSSLSVSIFDVVKKTFRVESNKPLDFASTVLSEGTLTPSGKVEESTGWFWVKTGELYPNNLKEEASNSYYYEGALEGVEGYVEITIKSMDGDTLKRDLFVQ